MKHLGVSGLLAVPRRYPNADELAEWHGRVEALVEECFGPDEPDSWHEQFVEQYATREEGR